MHVLSQVDAINFANEQPHRHWKLVRYDGPSRRAVFCCASENCFLVAEGVTTWRYAHPWQSVHFDLRPVLDPADEKPAGSAPSSEPPRRYWLDITADASGDGDPGNGVRSVFACGGSALSVLLYQAEDLRNDLALACLYLRAQEPEAGVLRWLLPGVEPDYVREQGQSVGLTLPDEVADWFGEYNGVDAYTDPVSSVAIYHYGYRLAKVEEAVEEYAIGHSVGVLREGWFPVLVWGGYYVVVDTGTPDEQGQHAVWQVTREGDATRMFASLEAFARTLLAWHEEGALLWSAGQQSDIDYPKWAQVGARLNPDVPFWSEEAPEQARVVEREIERQMRRAGD